MTTFRLIIAALTIMVSALYFVIPSGCNKAEAKADKKQNRFYSYQLSFWADIYIMCDTATGTEWIVNYHGAIVPTGLKCGRTK